MNLMDAIYTRHSVRAYTDEPVSREALEQLMQAAVQAPTAMNLQPWAFGVIQGADRLKGYSDQTKAFFLEHIDEFTMLARYRDTFADAESNLCHGATAMIVIYAKPGGPTADIDCSLAAENLMLAATDLGLGTCWMGFMGFLLNQPEVQRELQIPEGYRAVAPIIIGHPQGPANPAPKNPPELLFWQE
jgi:nitroreductase